MQPQRTNEEESDDGFDPKWLSDRRTRYDSQKQSGRKALQLCGQVKVALHAILAGCADDAVRNLTVLAVRPAPHSGRLEVAVAIPPMADAPDREPFETGLRRTAGWIRAEVAAAINRRRAPELVWTFERA